MFDVPIVSPLQVAHGRRCAEDGHAAIVATYEEKMRTYHARCETEGIAFFPLVVNTFGGWHDMALTAITKLRNLAMGKSKCDSVMSR